MLAALFVLYMSVAALFVLACKSESVRAACGMADYGWFFPE
jgi:hypothetical protein